MTLDNCWPMAHQLSPCALALGWPFLWPGESFMDKKAFFRLYALITVSSLQSCLCILLVFSHKYSFWCFDSMCNVLKWQLLWNGILLSRKLICAKIAPCAIIYSTKGNLLMLLILYRGSNKLVLVSGACILYVMSPL